MAIKELTTRIALKYDTFENWSKTEVADRGANLVLLRGEIGICEVPSVNADTNFAPTVLFKVGDGEKTFKQLPWASAKAADVYGWAKKSEEEFKTWLNTEAKFATDEEVAAAVKVVSDGLAEVDARVVALENKFTGTDSVQGQLDALDGRLDTVEGAIEVINGEAAGSIKKAEADAKAYADGLIAAEVTRSDAKAKELADAAQSAAEATAASALATVKGDLEAADSALGGRIDGVSGRVSALEGDDGAIATGDAATLESAKAYADGLAGNYDAAGSAATAKSEAIAAAKSETESQVAALKGTLEAKDAELNTAIEANATAIATEKSARESAINTINNKLDVEKVSTAIATAKQEAIDSAATTAQGKVDALANGQVETNRVAISNLSNTVSSEIARVAGLVTAEAKDRDDADQEIIGRLESVEAFFKVEGDEKLDTALDTLKEIQEYLNGEGEATGGIIARVAANEEAIDALKVEFAEGGRVTVAENDIEALEGRATAVEGRATTLEGKVATLEAKPFDTYATKTEVNAVSERAELGITNAKTAQDEVDALEGVVGTLRTEYDVTKALATANEAAIDALEGRVGTAEGKIGALETASAKHAEKTYVDGELNKKVNVSDYETYQGTVNGALSDRYTKTEADGKFGLKTAVEKNASDITALTTRVGTAEGNISTLQGIVQTGNDSNANLRSAITALQELTGDNGAIRSEIAAAKKAGDDAAAAVDALSKGQVATNKTNIETISGKVTAIENGYVKASDLVGDYYVFNCGSSTTVTHVVPKN